MSGKIVGLSRCEIARLLCAGCLEVCVGTCLSFVANILTLAFAIPWCLFTALFYPFSLCYETVFGKKKNQQKEESRMLSIDEDDDSDSDSEQWFTARSFGVGKDDVEQNIPLTF